MRSASPNEKLYAQYYSRFEEVHSVLGRENSGLLHCLKKYNEKDYESAIECLNKLPSNSEKYFYLGMSYAEQEKVVSAINALNKVETMDSVLLEETNWYLALLYLKREGKQECKKRLLRIIKSNSFTYKKNNAKKLYIELGGSGQT